MIISTAKRKRSSIFSKIKIWIVISKYTNYIQSSANLLYIFSLLEQIIDQLFIVQNIIVELYLKLGQTFDASPPLDKKSSRIIGGGP